MKHARLDPQVIPDPRGWQLHVKLSQFDGRDADERMAAALDWAGYVDAAVVIDLEGERLTETPLFGLPAHVSFVGRVS